MVVEKFDIADPLRTRAIIDRYQVRAHKSLGQNFLRDPQVIDQIVDAADINSDDIILEVGPGIGGLTQQLAKVADHVYAWEIDQHLIPILRENLASLENITIIPADILQVNLEEFFTQAHLTQRTVKVVANLPYYITTPILMRFLQTSVPLQSLVLMMQKEVAQRVCAQPQHHEYGALSVSVQAKSAVAITQIVSRNAFIPQPKVDSAVVKFDLTADLPIKIADYAAFTKFAQIIFCHKRKTLWNNLLAYFGKTEAHRQELTQIYQQLGYVATIRAEQLTLGQIVELQGALSKLLSEKNKNSFN
ncbi:16S rRNA (adenine(1518)-N(6)/adenine(1519)-N(6))-dimethyltransferase RsmA [Bombilactobacillus bombi]|uniref:16S rRNA (adenine(1518)-N(6)/adenine(1519)-N(6))- dimethyltransferase RsmA n=1 Tax=Bombilactobacillus bombi TaxID=1303590 RepID=UPI0015E5F94F|nr:16S rRNA (adenine(1518)-N(6)/adenine(1519)-N(6))-dimethyltransferase RsmA [Bombilactobacillus bombi]MBA1434246.1 16S rRNA (adenine(1518)-N(6)/adenine(1519)-N(6))-dimethyltransferase RsmA [Bombilactobacillus bombi]